jgi:TadE-like protein
MSKIEVQSSRARTRRARGRGDRGGVLVEAAIVLPVLFMIVFGILEIGSALKSYSGAANAVRAGGRMASVAGNNADADRMIMERIAGEATGISDGEIEYVVIWHASATGEQPPLACRPAAQGSPNTSSVGVPDGGPTVDAIGACNIYHRPAAPGGAFDMATGNAAQPPAFYFGCSGANNANKVDCNWQGKNRRTTITPRCQTSPCPTPQQPDYVGVYIKAEHEYVTGVLGDTVTITDGSINLLEPQGYSVTG